MAGLVIGLTAYAGSGKTAVAEMLKKQGFSHAKFAAPLKAGFRGMLSEMGFRPDTIERMVEGDLKESSFGALSGSTPREWMQWLGNEARETFGEDVWVNPMIHKLLDFKAGPVIIDDVRYANEANAIRGLGGFIWHIDRPGVGPVNGHVSENIVPSDLTINNDSDLLSLENDVATALLFTQHEFENRKGKADV